MNIKTAIALFSVLTLVFGAGLFLGIFFGVIVVPTFNLEPEGFKIGPWDFGMPVPATAEYLLSSEPGIHFDLEENIAGWEDIKKWDQDWNYVALLEDAALLPTSEEERGLGYNVTIKPEEWVNYTVEYPEPVKADMIVAQLFAPDSPNLEEAWVEITVMDENGSNLALVGDSIDLGNWKQLVLDLRRQYDPNGSLLCDTPVFVQIVFALKGAKDLESETVVVRLDDVALLRATGTLSVREQRGVGRTLFDFENWDSGGWQLFDSRVATDTLGLDLWGTAYRGTGSLRLDTSLGAGGKTWVSTVWRGAPPHGGWVAQVHLPEDVPADTKFWANFFTYDKTGWTGNETSDLKKGAWTPLVWDTSDVDWGDESQITIGIQIGAEGGSYEGSIYIDDVQVFER
jgi:hypothetical protein